jgi:hypothetical protein
MVEILTFFIFLNFQAKWCKEERIEQEQWELQVQLLNKRCLALYVQQLELLKCSDYVKCWSGRVGSINFFGKWQIVRRF